MDHGRLWHVTLTLGGHAEDVVAVCAALNRLAAEQPFIKGGRYSGDRVELEYWEEADGCEDAAALALRLWGEHRETAGLPPWSVLGLEVVEQDTLVQREEWTSARALTTVPPRGTGRWRLLP